MLFYQMHIMMHNTRLGMWLFREQILQNQKDPTEDLITLCLDFHLP